MHIHYPVFLFLFPLPVHAAGIENDIFHEPVFLFLFVSAAPIWHFY